MKKLLFLAAGFSFLSLAAVKAEAVAFSTGGEQAAAFEAFSNRPLTVAEQSKFDLVANQLKRAGIEENINTLVDKKIVKPSWVKTLLKYYLFCFVASLIVGGVVLLAWAAALVTTFVLVYKASKKKQMP